MGDSCMTRFSLAIRSPLPPFSINQGPHGEDLWIGRTAQVGGDKDPALAQWSQANLVTLRSSVGIPINSRRISYVGYNC